MQPEKGSDGAGEWGWGGANGVLDEADDASVVVLQLLQQRQHRAERAVVVEVVMDLAASMQRLCSDSVLGWWESRAES